MRSSSYHTGVIEEGPYAGQRYTIRISDHPAKLGNFWGNDELEGRVLSLVIADDMERLNEWREDFDEIDGWDGDAFFDGEAHVEQVIFPADLKLTKNLADAVVLWKKTGRAVGVDDAGNAVGLDYGTELQGARFSLGEEEHTDDDNADREREAALRDGLVEVLRDAGIEVVTDIEEGQRVLDAVNGRVQAMGFANSREEFDNTRDRAVAETGIVMTGLAEEEVTVVDVPRHDFTGVAPIKQAEAWGKKNLVTPKDKKGNYIDKPKLKDGTEYSISSNAVGKFLSKSATKNSDNLGVHLSVLKKLKDVIHESMEAEVHPDYKKDETGKRDPKNGYNPDYLVHRLYGAVDIDGKTYRVKTTIIENGNESRNYPHSYEVTEIELLDDSMAGSESRSVNIGREGHDTKNRLSNNSIAGAKLLQGVEKSYDPGKKLLDESEKSTESGVNLHRVWHGSGAEFDAFDHSHMGEGEGAQAYGWGTYVTEVEDIGRRYAEIAGGVRYKGHDVDELYEHSIDGI